MINQPNRTKRHFAKTHKALMSAYAFIPTLTSGPSLCRWGMLGLLVGSLYGIHPGLGYAETNWRDVPLDFWAKDAIQFLSEQGIINGYADHTFQPYRPVTRAEFAAILAKSMRASLSKPTKQAPNFVDVPRQHWANAAIGSVVAQGWMNGFPNHQFRPNQILTQGELYAILGKAQSTESKLSNEQVKAILAPYRDQDELPKWARQPVAQAIISGITLSERSKTRLSPDIPAVRSSVAASVAKAINPTIRTNAPESQAIESTPTVVQAIPTAVEPQSSPSPSLASTLSISEAAIPAANLVGQLQAGETSEQWVLVRPDGQRFRLDPNQLETGHWQAGQQVRVTGNLDAVRGTASDPLVVVQTCFPLDTVRETLSVPVTPAGSDSAKTAPAADTTPEKSQPEVQVSETPETQQNTSDLIASESPIALPPEIPQERDLKAEPPAQATAAKDTEKSNSEIATAKAVAAEAVSSDALPEAEVQPLPGPLKLYFPNLVNLVSDPKLMLGEPIPRKSAKPIKTPPKAIEAILQGPTESEQRDGYFMDADLKRLRLGKFSLKANGLASVQLDAPGDFQFSNSSVSARLDEQIRRTLKQFQGVQRVKVSVKTPQNKVLWISP